MFFLQKSVLVYTIFLNVFQIGQYVHCISLVKMSEMQNASPVTGGNYRGKAEKKLDQSFIKVEIVAKKGMFSFCFDRVSFNNIESIIFITRKYRSYKIEHIVPYYNCRR